jgi:tRNA nucleotidyltransferase/poly(A) polymerase
MTAEYAVRILDTLGQHGVDACVGGGWAVDALLGEQTRAHTDLDPWLPAADSTITTSRCCAHASRCPSPMPTARQRRESR